jgi:hypothetical protein
MYVSHSGHRQQGSPHPMRGGEAGGLPSNIVMNFLGIPQYPVC